MRGFGGSRGLSEFELGFFWGVVTAVGGAVALRAAIHIAQWESVTEAREAVAALLSTPVLSVGDLILIVAVLLIIACAAVANVYMGGFRA